jgi:hypothetical protein
MPYDTNNIGSFEDHWRFLKTKLNRNIKFANAYRTSWEFRSNGSKGSRFNGGRVERAKRYDCIQYPCLTIIGNLLLIKYQELYQDLFGQIMRRRTVHYRSTIVGKQCWVRRKLEKELCIPNTVCSICGATMFRKIAFRGPTGIHPHPPLPVGKGFDFPLVYLTILELEIVWNTIVVCL